MEKSTCQTVTISPSSTGSSLVVLDFSTSNVEPLPSSKPSTSNLSTSVPVSSTQSGREYTTLMSTTPGTESLVSGLQAPSKFIRLSMVDDGGPIIIDPANIITFYGRGKSSPKSKTRPSGSIIIIGGTDAPFVVEESPLQIQNIVDSHAQAWEDYDRVSQPPDLELIPFSSPSSADTTVMSP